MNQRKIGKFLQELRKEKNLTQEQLAEKLNVARRTVSRWETGFNLPDIDILIKLSDINGVDLRELLDGERRGESMDKEMKDAVIKVAEYGTEQRKRHSRIVLVYFILGITALLVNTVLRSLDLKGHFWLGFIDGATVGLSIGSMVLGILYNTGAMEKVHAFKMRLLGKGR